MTQTIQQSGDADLRQLVEARDFRRAFEGLLERYQNKVFRLAYSMLRNPTAAEDMTQDIFLRIWKGLPGYNGKASLSTWIYTISRNTCLSELKKRANRPTVSLDHHCEEFGMDHMKELRVDSAEAGVELDIDHCLDQLPDKYRRVIVLYYLEQKSYEETAQMLGLPLGTVKTFLYRAKRELLKIASRKTVVVSQPSQSP